MNSRDKRRAMISIGLDPKGLDTGIAAVRARLRKQRQEIERAEKKANAKRERRNAAIGGFMGGIASGGVTAVFGKVASMASDAATETMDVERALTRLQIAGGRSTMQMHDFREVVTATSKKTGVARGEIIGAAAAYTALTGDAEGAAAGAALFTDVSVASGASIADVATAAAALKENMRLDPKEFRKAFDVLITQGKLGSIEISNLAAELSSLAPQFAAFKDAATAEGVADLGAHFQVIAKAFGSAAEARTGFMSLMTQLVKKRKELAKHGVNVYDAKGNKRNFSDVMKDLSKLSETKVVDLLQESGAIRASMAVKDYADTLARIKKESKDSNATEIDKAAYLTSAAGKMEVAMNGAKLAIAEAFTPERIQAFVNVLGKAAEQFAKIVGFIDRIISTTPEQAYIDKVGAKVGNEVLRNRGVKNPEKLSWGEKYGMMQGPGGAAGMYGGAPTFAEKELAKEQVGKDLVHESIATGVGGGGEKMTTSQRLARITEWQARAGETTDPLAARQAYAVGTARESYNVVNEQLQIIIKIGEDAAAKALAEAKLHRKGKKGR
jgi:hypothetical protein